MQRYKQYLISKHGSAIRPRDKRMYIIINTSPDKYTDNHGRYAYHLGRTPRAKWARLINLSCDYRTDGDLGEARRHIRKAYNHSLDVFHNYIYVENYPFQPIP